MRDEYLVFGAPAIDEEDIESVAATLRTGWIGTGPKTAEFEKAFAEYVGAAHAVAVSSCTAALHLSLVAAGIGPGDDVVVPAMTFVATANAVLHAGARPVLCDVDLETQNMRVEDVERVLTPKTRAVIPVHFAGRAVNLTALCAFAADHDLVVINDAAHAIETMHCGRGIAQYGSLTAYSFYPTKNITTGEGGMVVTSDPALADRVRMLRQHGLSADAWKRYSNTGFKHYEAVELGFKCNMTDVQASLGLGQLARIGRLSSRRSEIWQRYDEAFAGFPLRRPAPVPACDRHGLHLYTVLLDVDEIGATRDQIAGELHKHRIGTGVHYRGVHLQPLYRERLRLSPADFPNATHISERTLSLPLSAKLADADVDDVIGAMSWVMASTLGAKVA